MKQNMIYGKDIKPVCALCENAVPIDDETMLCRKKGPMGLTDSCRAFKYDPLMRKPSSPTFVKAFSEKDFKL